MDNIWGEKKRESRMTPEFVSENWMKDGVCGHGEQQGRNSGGGRRECRIPFWPY